MVLKQNMKKYPKMKKYLEAILMVKLNKLFNAPDYYYTWWQIRLERIKKGLI